MDAYDSVKVGQLRLLCKQRGLNPDGKKEELVSRLMDSDATVSAPSPVPTAAVMDLSAEDMKEIATVADEIRHIRRQWVRFFTSYLIFSFALRLPLPRRIGALLNRIYPSCVLIRCVLGIIFNYYFCLL
jgi:hypothetical protein